MGKGVVGEGGKVSGSSAQSKHQKAVEAGDHCRNNNYGPGDLASAKQLVYSTMALGTLPVQSS